MRFCQVFGVLAILCLYLLSPNLVFGQQRLDQLLEKGEYQQVLDRLNDRATLSRSERMAKLQALIRLGNLAEADTFAQKQRFTQPAEKAVLGELLLNQGRYRAAEEALQSALATDEEKRRTQARSNLGILNWVSGNTSRAETLLRQALDESQRVYGVTHPQTGGAYNNLGLVLAENDPQAAIRMYLQAQTIYEGNYPENHPSKASTLSNLAAAYLQENVYLNAQNYYKQALTMWKALYGDTHPNVAFTYAALAQVALRETRPERADEYARKALQTYQQQLQAAQHPKLSSTYNLLASIALRKDEYGEAIRYLTKAEQTNVPPEMSPKQALSTDLLLTTLQLRGEAFAARHRQKTLKLRDLKAALAAYTAADDLLQHIRQNRADESDKLRLGERANEIYDAATRLCLRLAEVTLRKKHYYKRAFYFSERSKAGVLLSAIADTQAKQFAGIPDSLLAQERAQRERLDFLERQISQGNTEFRAEWLAAQQQREAFIRRLETEFPEYYQLKYDVSISDAGTVQTHLKKDETLLSYQLLEQTDRIVVFYLTQRSIRVEDRPLPENFRALQRSFRNSITFQAKGSYQESAYDLYKSLFPKPVRTSRVFIVPEGALSSIPFEALLTEKAGSEAPYTDLSYWVRQKTISYAYAATLWTQQRQRKADTASTCQKKQALLCAPVHFVSLNSLPATETEVRELSTLFDKQEIQSSSYLNARATKSVLQQQDLQCFGLLHLATHGIIDQDNPSLSYLALSGDDRFYTGELYNLKLNADLVTLSACETGLGKLTAGEGLIGLSRALLFAGARNVVVSLWSVADDSTAKLMQTFYESSLNHPGTHYADALNQTQRRMINDSKYSNPFYWAPFVVIGE